MPLRRSERRVGANRLISRQPFQVSERSQFAEPRVGSAASAQIRRVRDDRDVIPGVKFN